ncbi:GNAT family N-acetyltransferase [Sporolactobacillus putidus]|uniref:N-acetyltransferase YdgE n=1 Tax=Sporolactobacillus putidus TaxID=492735 RepID=A0A917RXE8_9BACL|nr:GNAT family N-acetyltransferase [Sporolactobacillus putidus]GGL42633.1 putative N-acetyltransferase YdgE [Sporolactobacillus putidus]
MTVKITEMKETDFHPYMRRMVQEYAVEKQRTGTWTAEEALQNAIDEFNRLLPRGFFTPDNHFFTFLDDLGRGIGRLWLYYHLNDLTRDAFIYDFEIFSAFRDQGFGQAALNELFHYCRRIGLEKLSLHVFAHNQRAIHVYRKLGFTATDINMFKYL